MARQAARESIVMLENKENLLPLSKTLRTIAVVGPGADAVSYTHLDVYKRQGYGFESVGCPAL